jgi:hypothetical protein
MCLGGAVKASTAAVVVMDFRIVRAFLRRRQGLRLREAAHAVLEYPKDLLYK